jgi:uncharacterized protein (TIGR03067 family)
MFRTAVAILLASSASAWAQGPQTAEDQKRLQGTWRVHEIVGALGWKEVIRQMQFTFEGNKVLMMLGPDPAMEHSYSIDPEKDPKQIDFIYDVPQAAVAGQKPPARRQNTVAGIYAFEQDHLKLHFAREPGDRRPADFKVGAKGEDAVFVLERDTSEAARNILNDARILLAIRGLGGEASGLADDPRTAAPIHVYVKLGESKGNALLLKIVPRVKTFNHAIVLELDGSNVTDGGLAAVKEIDKLERLSLERTVITDAGLEHLRKLDRLQSLNVSQTKVTDAGIASLRKSLPRLAVRHLTSAQRNSEKAILKAGGLVESDDNGRLTAIRFAEPEKLTDGQLHELADDLETWRETLRSIDLTNSGVTDEGLLALSGLTGLRQLTLKGTGVTVAGVKKLQKSVPNLRVKH